MGVSAGVGVRAVFHPCFNCHPLSPLPHTHHVYCTSHPSPVVNVLVMVGAAATDWDTVAVVAQVWKPVVGTHLSV